MEVAILSAQVDQTTWLRSKGIECFRVINQKLAVEAMNVKGLGAIGPRGPTKLDGDVVLKVMDLKASGCFEGCAKHTQNI